MSNVWTGEEDGRGAEPKMRSVAFCVQRVSPKIIINKTGCKPAHPNRRCSKHRLRPHRQWCCLFLATAVQHAVGRRSLESVGVSKKGTIYLLGPTKMDEEPVLPPRYAIESDDEDEFNPLPNNKLPLAEPEIKVEITGNIPQNVNLIVVAGSAGQTWARGAKLTERSGQVSVNGVQV